MPRSSSAGRSLRAVTARGGALNAAFLWGSWGFVAGRLACTVCVLAVRRAYVLQLMPCLRPRGERPSWDAPAAARS